MNKPDGHVKKKSIKEISIPLDDRPQKVASDIDSTAFALPLRDSG